MAATTTYCFEPNAVFENRNRAYGAFQLRRLYKRHVLIALAIASVFFSVGISSTGWFRTEDRVEWYDPAWKEHTFTSFEFERPIPAPSQPTPVPSTPQAATARFVPPVPVPDGEVGAEDIPPSQPDLSRVQAATVTQAGDANAGEVILEDRPVPPAPEAVIPQPEQPDKPVEIHQLQQMPEFPGGQKAMLAFFKKEIRYPDMARLAGVSGRVYVQFVIGKNGEIRDAEVVRGIGAGLDEEALRAVRAMPRWIPGKHRGVAVPVRFSMPIQFKLQ